MNKRDLFSTLSTSVVKSILQYLLYESINCYLFMSHQEIRANWIQHRKGDSPPHKLLNVSSVYWSFPFPVRQLN